jgi:hypothetical protein
LRVVESLDKSWTRSCFAHSGIVRHVRSVAVDDGRGELARHGLVCATGPFATPEDAWRCAHELVGLDGAIAAPIEVIGNFVIPPADGVPSRNFQTLHFDFGVPLVPAMSADVARYTALHVPVAATSMQAITRFVPLAALLRGHPWPHHDELVRRFTAYGNSHGTWEADTGYVEGSLARIIEAALGETPVLPSVRADPDFLCGTEFATLADEMLFFTQRGLRVDAVVIEVRIRPGELLVFDNRALAHGRRGTRAAGELHQRIFGHRALHPREQTELRDRVLAAFTD